MNNLILKYYTVQPFKGTHQRIIENCITNLGTLSVVPFSCTLSSDPKKIIIALTLNSFPSRFVMRILRHRRVT